MSLDSTSLAGIGKMFEGLSKLITPGKEPKAKPKTKPTKKSFVETIDKAIVDRETDTGFISVSADGKNVTILGYNLPEDTDPEDHELVDRYGVLLYRQGEKARDEFIILAEGTTVGEAQNYAIERVENNRTNVFWARVFVGVPWTFNGRSVFRGFVSFWLISRSDSKAVGLTKSDNFSDVIHKTKINLSDANVAGFMFDDSLIEKAAEAAELLWANGLGFKPIAKSAHSDKDMRYVHFLDKSAVQAVISYKPRGADAGNGGVKKSKYTNETWVDPTPDLSVDELSKCVPAGVLAFVKRYASIDSTPVTKAMLVYPYKTADGRVNLNEAKKILAELTKDKGSWNYDMPPSVCKDIVTELREVTKEATSKISHDVSFISKAATLERGLVYGLVYEPLVKDTHEDFATAEDIEAAAHNYLPAAMQNVEHDGEQTLTNADGTVVESYIAPCDFMVDEEEIIKGSWILVTKIHTEDLREKIRNGEITGYSMEGTAFKV